MNQRVLVGQLFFVVHPSASQIKFASILRRNDPDPVCENIIPKLWNFVAKILPHITNSTERLKTRAPNCSSVAAVASTSAIVGADLVLFELGSTNQKTSLSGTTLVSTISFL